MTPKIPMQDDEIKMHKPLCAEFVDFRAGIRCAERVYDVAKLIAELEQEQRDNADLAMLADQYKASATLWNKRYQDACQDRIALRQKYGAEVEALEAPAAREPLTDEQIDKLRFSFTAQHHTERDRKLVRLVENAHGIGTQRDGV